MASDSGVEGGLHSHTQAMSRVNMQSMLAASQFVQGSRLCMLPGFHNDLTCATAHKCATFVCRQETAGETADQQDGPVRVHTADIRKQQHLIPSMSVVLSMNLGVQYKVVNSC
jgi:hypothetical protein